MARTKSDNLIIGAAVGSGISALAAEEGGADFLLAINAARFRNMGSPSIACMLPTHDANDLSIEFAVNEILPRAKLPVLIGLTCWHGDEEPAQLAERVKQLGFAGVVNFPSAMHFSQDMRQILDGVGMGTRKEAAVLKAVQDLGLQALCYCGSRSQARFAAETGLRRILFNFGWNVGGVLGHAPRITLEESSMIARDIGRLVKSIDPGIEVFLEGGPIISSDDLGFVARHAPLDGYVGGSTLDRLPFETSVANRIAGYKSAKAARRQIEETDQSRLKWAERHGFVGQSQAMLDFLKQFYTLAWGADPFAVCLEQGLDEAPILNALKSRSRKQTLVIDPLHVDTPLQATRQLLGVHSQGTTAIGALFRAEVGQIVLRNPHLLSAPAQRRLASALKVGAAPHPKSRSLMPVTARLVCFLPHAAKDCSNLDPALRDVLDGWDIRYPSLRDRADDIMTLLEEKLQNVNPAPILSAAAGLVLRGYSWPANDQELSRAAGAMAREFSGQMISQADARELIGRAKTEQVQRLENSDERRAIADALWRNGFHKGNTANALGISRKTLYNKMRKYDLMS